VIKTVNVRGLKDKLSAYLRDVQDGHVVLVSDRGRVVAELRKPTFHQQAADALEERRQRLIDSGVLRVGLPNAASAYAPADVHLSEQAVDAALEWSRGDR